MFAVQCFVDRPRLAEECAPRGLRLVPDPSPVLLATVADATALATWRRHSPSAAIVALVGDAAGEAALLDAGAEDTIVSNACDALVAARLAAVCRRRGATSRLVCGELTIDLVAHRASRAGCALDLLPREYALLLQLARHADAPVARRALLEAVWGLDFDPGTNVIQVHVSRLRAKLDRGFSAPMLLTDKGCGYRLRSIAPGVAAAARAG